MSLKLTILGCGTSSGVPRIGNDWGACDPDQPKNRRTRVSILVESPTTRLLVDTSPDMRAQLLAADVIHIDAILWTHDHADHSHGIDDVRQLYHHRRAPVPGYARRQTLKLLKERFAYAFEGRQGYHPTIEPHVLPDGLRIGDIDIACTDQPHGEIFSTGFRFTYAGKSIGYATDFHAHLRRRWSPCMMGWTYGSSMRCGKSRIPRIPILPLPWMASPPFVPAAPS